MVKHMHHCIAKIELDQYFAQVAVKIQKHDQHFIHINCYNNFQKGLVYIFIFY